MKLITVNSNYKQKQSIILDDGTIFTMSISFRPRQQGWFITDLSYDDFELKGLRIVVSPNLLLQYKNIIPFGLACYSQGNREPMLKEDFSSKNVNLYLLTQSEVEEMVTLVNG
jgi:hypothetical protein